MSFRSEKILVLFITLLISAGVLVWSFFLHFGKISIEANQPFEIQGIGKQTITCLASPCLIKVPTGVFNASFKAKDFREIQGTVEIQRFQTTSVKLTFEYQPILKKLNQSFLKEQLPLPSSLQAQIAPTWNFEKTKVAYLKTDNFNFELWIWDKNTKKTTKITNFYNFIQPVLFWDQINQFILVQNQADFYLVDLLQKQKQKLFNLENKTPPLFSPNSTQILFNQKQALSFYNLETKISTPLNLKTDSNQLIWKDENSLIYTVIQNNSTSFYEYNFSNQTQSTILEVPFPEIQNLTISSDLKHLYFQSGSEYFEILLSQ